VNHVANMLDSISSGNNCINGEILKQYSSARVFGICRRSHMHFFRNLALGGAIFCRDKALDHMDSRAKVISHRIHRFDLFLPKKVAYRSGRLWV